MILFPQVPVEDLKNASKLLVKALEVRQKYMKMSHQSFPNMVKRLLRSMHDKNGDDGHHDDPEEVEHQDKATLEGESSARRGLAVVYSFEQKIPGVINNTYNSSHSRNRI